MLWIHKAYFDSEKLIFLFNILTFKIKCFDTIKLAFIVEEKVDYIFTLHRIYQLEILKIFENIFESPKDSTNKNNVKEMK